jgi:hypothetical protein
MIARRLEVSKQQTRPFQASSRAQQAGSPSHQVQTQNSPPDPQGGNMSNPASRAFLRLRAPTGAQIDTRLRREERRGQTLVRFQQHSPAQAQRQHSASPSSGGPNHPSQSSPNHSALECCRTRVGHPGNRLCQSGHKSDLLPQVPKRVPAMAMGHC